MKQLLCTLTAVLIIAQATAKPATDAPEASSPPVPALVTVTIGDIPGILDRAGRLAAKVAGMDPAQIKTQLGAMLDDPKLEGLPDGSGFTAIVPREGKPFGFIEIAETKKVQYESVLRSRGIAARAVTGGFILAQTEDDLTAAAPHAAALKESLSGSGKPTVNFHVQVAALMEQYKEQIQAGMEQMNQKVDSAAGKQKEVAGQTEMFKKAMTMYYNFGRSVETIDVSFDVSAKGLQVEKTIVPVKKSDVAPASAGKGPAADVLSNYLPGTGALRGEIADMGMFSDLSFRIIEFMSADTTASKDAAGLQDMAKKTREIFSGPAAMDYFGTGKELSGGQVFSVSDGDKALRFIEEFSKTPNSLSAMYEAMGLKMDIKFEKNVRQHNGIQIHRQVMKMDTSNISMPAEQAGFLSNMKAELAMHDNKMFYAMGSTRIEDMLDAAKSGKSSSATPLLSRASFPPDAMLYLDYNFGKLMKLAPHMQSTTATLGISRVADALASAPPIQIAGYKQDSGFRFITLLPAEMIRSAAQSFAGAAPARQSKQEPENKTPSNVE